MDKDNSQEPMITSNSPSLEKGREKVYYSSNPAFYVGIDCIIFGFYEGEISLLLLKRASGIKKWMIVFMCDRKRRICTIMFESRILTPLTRRLA